MRLNDEPNTNNSRRTPVVIGLTGGIGSGKSTCAAAAISTGIAVFDCDEACVNAYKSDAFMERYRAALSSPNGCSDDEASALARKASNYRQRVSPLLRDHVIGELDQFLDSRANEPVVVIDAPLLFEWELDRCCDHVICLVADQALRLKRVLARREPAMTAEDFWDVVSRQMDDPTRISRSSSVIHTDGDEEKAKNEFLRIVSGLLDQKRNIAHSTPARDL